MKIVLSLACTAALLAAATDVHADGHSDRLGPREMALGEATRAEPVGASAITLNPAGLGLTRELVFEGSYAYHSAVASAHRLMVSGCDSTVPVPGCFYYRYDRQGEADDGSAPASRVHEFGSTLARGFGRQLYFGLTTRYFDYEDDAVIAGDSSGFGVDLGLLVRLVDMLSVAAVGYNLLSAEAPPYPRSVGAGLTLRPFGPLAISADGMWNLDSDDGSSARYGGGAEYFVRTSDMQTGFPLRAGVVHDTASDTTFVTGGLAVVTKAIGFDVGARKELGGDGFAIVASLRVFGPRLASGGTGFAP
ncbi:hypothetical protein [Haliangium sp.]|uniref:hypothetical protein n=1 Tax=Haliangium sp. TaxID=2663208 RepID=UPI003D0A7B7C